MKLQQLFEKQINSPNASLTYKFKTDLAKEESKNYLPHGYDYKKVIEIEVIKIKDLENGYGKGYGKEIFDKFLQSIDAKKAELIFLDISPLEDLDKKQKLGELAVMDKLEQVYKSWGFRNNSTHMRMWFVNKGEIQDQDLPT